MKRKITLSILIIFFAFALYAVGVWGQAGSLTGSGDGWTNYTSVGAEEDMYVGDDLRVIDDVQIDGDLTIITDFYITGMVYLGGGLLMPDDTTLLFGDDSDASMEYDEDGTNQLRITGSTIYEDAVEFDTAINCDAGMAVEDDQAVIFGTESDASVEYDEDGTDQLRFTGAAIMEDVWEFDSEIDCDAGIAIEDDQAITFGTESDVTAEYDEDGNDELQFTGAVGFDNAPTFRAGGHVLDDLIWIFGTESDASIEYDEDGTDQLRVVGDTIFEDNVELGTSLDLDYATASEAVCVNATNNLVSQTGLSCEELGYLSTTTSNVQTQIDSKIGDPGAVTDNGVVRWDGITGYTVQDTSGVTISDAFLLTASGGLSVGSSTTGLDFTGTYTDGISFAGATPTYGQENAFVDIGTYTTPYAAVITDVFIPVQVHIDNSGNPGSAKDLAAARFRVDNITNPQGNVNSHVIQTRQGIAQNIKGFAGIQQSTQIVDNITVESHGYGTIAKVEGSGNLTGSYSVLGALMYHTGTTSGDNFCVEAEVAAGGDGTAIYKGNVQATGTSDYGLQIVNAGTLTTGISLSGSIGTDIDLHGLTIDSDGSNLAISGVISANNGIIVPDDIPITFGTESDVTMQYDEDGNDELQFSGDVGFDDCPVLRSGADVLDDEPITFGTEDDATIEYDENGTNQLRITGSTIFEDAVEFDSSLDVGVGAGNDAITISDALRGLYMTGDYESAIKVEGGIWRRGLMIKETLDERPTDASDDSMWGVQSTLTHQIDEGTAHAIGVASSVTKDVGDAFQVVPYEGSVAVSSVVNRVAGMVTSTCVTEQPDCTNPNCFPHTTDFAYIGHYIYQHESNTIAGEGGLAIQGDWDYGINTKYGTFLGGDYLMQNEEIITNLVDGQINFVTDDNTRKVAISNIGYVSATALETQPPFAPFTCTGLAAGAGHIGSTLGYVTVEEGADFVLIGMSIPPLATLGAAADFVLEFEIKENAVSGDDDDDDVPCDLDVRIFSSADTNPVVTDTIAITGGAAKGWHGLVTASTGIGDVLTVGEGYLIELTANDDNDNFDLYRVRMTYLSGVENDAS